MKLLIHPAVEAERFAMIVQAVGGMKVVNVGDSEAARREITDADGFFGKITPDLLAAAKQLRWVQSPTASLEHYVFPELIEHPCVLTNMRGLFSDIIANHVFGFILCFARNFHTYVRNQMAHRWAPVGGEDPRPDYTVGPGHVIELDRRHLHLSDHTLGVVGLGQIGSEVARRGLAFGMRVVAVDPMQREAPAGVEALWRMDRLGDLLGESDFVVIAAPHTPETVKMFRRPQFLRMKRSAYLINIGRGVIVDLDDLVEALQTGMIAGAGLDVFETEPLPAEHPLWDMENVIITPHIAGYSLRIPERHLAVLLDNVGRFARGEELRNVVNKAMWF
jgi:phosphoglycerate dehydrogenase-like enzyme